MTAEYQQNKKAIVEGLDQPADKSVEAMAAKLSKRPGVAAILFYGNRLRNEASDGLLDFYVLTDSNTAYHGTGPSAFFNRILPPNVYFEEVNCEEGLVSAKVAVISLSQFRLKMSPKSMDTTLWARFSQPSLLVYCRDQESRQKVIDAILSAYETALWWAFRLFPDAPSSTDLWTNLYTSTYGAELRVEGGKRSEMIVDKSSVLYGSLYKAFLNDAAKHPITKNNHRTSRRQWALRRFVGKTLNFLRLIKAATTFSGGISYALSKVERHSGRPVALKRWERRFPWLAAPFVFCRLLIERRLR